MIKSTPLWRKRYHIYNDADTVVGYLYLAGKNEANNDFYFADYPVLPACIERPVLLEPLPHLLEQPVTLIEGHRSVSFKTLSQLLEKLVEDDKGAFERVTDSRAILVRPYSKYVLANRL